MPTPPPWWNDTQVAPPAVERRAFSSGQSETASEPSFIASVSRLDRKSTRLNSSHVEISYAVFCLKKKTGRIPRFLIKDSLFRIRGVRSLLRGASQIPVSRGTAAARHSLEGAHAALARGEAVCISPQGTVTRDTGCWPMQARTGVARLTLATHATVIPVANWGLFFF